MVCSNFEKNEIKDDENYSEEESSDNEEESSDDEDIDIDAIEDREREYSLPRISSYELGRKHQLDVQEQLLERARKNNNFIKKMLDMCGQIKKLKSELTTDEKKYQELYDYMVIFFKFAVTYKSNLINSEDTGITIQKLLIYLDNQIAYFNEKDKNKGDILNRILNNNLDVTVFKEGED